MWILIAALTIPTLIITYVLNHPTVRGWIGERRVRKQLERLPREHYRVLNNLMLNAKKGTSQIDHVVISPYGIFAIETKNYKGWIHGKEDSEYWTQSFYPYKTRFRNPIKQNWGHILTLKETLPQYKDLSYHPVIVFAGKAKLANVNVRTDVIHPDKLFDLITNRKEHRQLRDHDIEKIFEVLTNSSIKDRELRRQHVDRIKGNLKLGYLKEKALMCPKCGGRLTKRHGRYGEFYGCENYPTCKHTTKLSIPGKDHGQQISVSKSL